MDIELDPKHYRVKGRKLVKYLALRPFTRAATISGVWAGCVWSAQTFLRLEPAWPYLLAAFSPIVIVFITWLLLGGEDAVEPPRRPKREHPHWRIVPRD